MLSEFLSQYYREIFEYSTERGIVLRETISRMKYLNLFFFFFIEIPREENRNKRSIFAYIDDINAVFTSPQKIITR